MPLGVIVRRAPGVTRWAPWVWRAVAVVPGAAEAHWKVLREENDITEYHAATVPLKLHGSDAEAYLNGLAARVPSVYVVMRASGKAERPYEVLLVTASPHESQDYGDSGEEIVEKIPMPEGLLAWVRTFALEHFEEEEFKKRRRDKKRIDRVEDGKGDARIPQMSDVYRSPGAKRKERLQ
ncbi:DUF3305 domain-containing protein [Marimonas sp. MJW-29]|uniref:DUF3305 domain-containing protein n=1 Tax=Sulfitobacter sediminis TaxID=3234186 RepID=A0ABV3RKT5_9RHOB